MEEVFGEDNFCGLINFAKTTGAGSPSGGTDLLPQTSDYLLWFARDRMRVRFRQVFLPRRLGSGGATQYTWIDRDGERRPATADELERPPSGAHIFAHDNLTSQTAGETTTFPISFEGGTFTPGKGGWKTNAAGVERLRQARRLLAIGSTLRYVRYFDDFPVVRVLDRWDDTVISGFGAEKLYVVQTLPKVIERCVLMTTDPGDLVLDPTCGSGTTVYVAEQWRRRWITIDTSRVPLALARQRLLTATFPYYQLKDEARGPAGGFVYVRKKNQKGEEVGGIVPHVTLKSIANGEPPDEGVLVDRPEVTNSITRVTGPFCVEATIPTPVDYEADTSAEVGAGSAEDHGSFVDRMLEVLRKSPVIQVGGGKRVTLKNVRPPAKTLSLSAEAMVANGAENSVAFVFGPENGAVSEKLVHDAAFEAHGKGYTHLYMIGFAIQPNARNLIDNCEEVMSIPATYARPDHGRSAEDDALKPDFQRVRFTRSEAAQAPLSRRERGGGRGSIPGRTRGPRRVRSNRDEGGPSPRRGCAGLVPRHRLQWSLLPRLAGVLSAHERVGQLEEGVARNVRRSSLGPSGGHRQRALRGGRARPDRSQGDRRPRQRVDGWKGLKET